MSRRALIILLAGLPIAAPAQGQAVYRLEPPSNGEEHGYVHRRHPQFRSGSGRSQRRYQTAPLSDDSSRGQRPRQESDGEATENQIAQLQSENAALKQELAARMLALESQNAGLQSDNAALKDLLTRSAEIRAALEGEIARLQTENAALKKQLSAHALLPPDAGKADPPTSAAGQQQKLPNNADLDRGAGVVEKAWRRLIEVMGSLKRG